MRGATSKMDVLKNLVRISIHAPHARSDLATSVGEYPPLYFNPRSSCEERPIHYSDGTEWTTISIHAPHARSDVGIASGRGDSRISIHAPHARSDAYGYRLSARHQKISIHAPHARSDRRRYLLRCIKHISIHAPHARSDESNDPYTAYYVDISIHAPHARSDWPTSPQRFEEMSNFNPRSSCEERLKRAKKLIKFDDISIHAPHARSDRRSSSYRTASLGYFNPRSSCEERLDQPFTRRNQDKFQSTLLMRGATRLTLLM